MNDLHNIVKDINPGRESNELHNIVERIINNQETIEDYKRFEDLVDTTGVSKEFFQKQLELNDLDWNSFYTSKRNASESTKWRSSYILGLFKALDS